MSQLPALSQPPATTSGDIAPDTVNAKGNGRSDIKAVVIDPHPGRKAPAAHKMHTFEFRLLLQAQRLQLLNELREKSADAEAGFGLADPSKNAAADTLTNAADQSSVAMAIRKDRKLLDIEIALARIGDNSYGICIDCGSAIDRARLKAEPTAQCCPPCQLFAESLAESAKS